MSLCILGTPSGQSRPGPHSHSQALHSTILVLQEVGKVEELWDELLHISRAL